MQFAKWFCLVAGIAAAAGCEQSASPEQPNSPAIGAMAPDFTLKALSGQMVTLSALRGKPVLLSFGAVGCGPCRLEAPELSALRERFGGRGLVVLTVNAWNEPRKTVEKYVAEHGLKQTMLLNGLEVFSQRYGCKYVPQVYLIDKAGKIAYSHLNFRPGDEKEIETQIARVL